MDKDLNSALEKRRTARKQVKQTYGRLYDEVAEILWKHDPIRIAFHTGEYESEVGTILPRLRKATSLEQITAIINEEFIWWFCTSLQEPKLNAIAADIYDAWQRYIRGEAQNDVLYLQQLEQSIYNSVLGTALGDAIGLPVEGLSKRRVQRFYRGRIAHRFFFGKGMTSDDTDHTIMVARALIASNGDVGHFRSELARRLKSWFLAIPAGVGLATLKSCLRLLLGASPERSGVYSAGNGPAMRSAVIGVAYGHDMPKMIELVSTSTKITHTDPKAEYGALAVAIAAFFASRGKTNPEEYFETLKGILGDDAKEFLKLVERTIMSAASNQSTEAFASELGLNKGITGYVYHTVPVVLQAWFRHKTGFETAISDVILCGGDTDTTAAILGGIMGASSDNVTMPQDWTEGLILWPESLDSLKETAKSLTVSVRTGQAEPTSSPSFQRVLFRNALFLFVVLAHGFRRLLPPY